MTVSAISGSLKFEIELVFGVTLPTGDFLMSPFLRKFGIRFLVVIKSHAPLSRFP